MHGSLHLTVGLQQISHTINTIRSTSSLEAARGRVTHRFHAPSPLRGSMCAPDNGPLPCKQCHNPSLLTHLPSGSLEGQPSIAFRFISLFLPVVFPSKLQVSDLSEATKLSTVPSSLLLTSEEGTYWTTPSYTLLGRLQHNFSNHVDFFLRLATCVKCRGTGSLPCIPH